jgi:tRNA G18 (ribose-2'-O)-methylase SpoU
VAASTGTIDRSAVASTEAGRTSRSVGVDTIGVGTSDDQHGEDEAESDHGASLLPSAGLPAGAGRVDRSRDERPRKLQGHVEPPPTGGRAPVLIPIEDPDDPRIAAYRSVRERDLVGRGGRFIAEGEVVLAVLLTRSRFAVESLLLAQSRVARVAALLARVGPGIPIYTATQAVIDAIAGFPIHRGILALGHRGDAPSAGSLLAGLPRRALVLGLVGIANHDNVGGIFRNAAAFGAAAVLLDPATCDPLYLKAIRVSVGASLIVPFARVPSADAMLEFLRGSGFEAVALSPSGREGLSMAERPDRIALLLGAEGRGLPADLLERMRSLRIPMAGGVDSLNVATASGIALYHFAAGKGAF